MPNTDSLTIVKSFTYRGKPEEFSNTYHLEGTTPVDLAGWKALADAVIASERPTVPTTVTFVQAYGYVAGNDLSVAQIDYRVAPNTVLAGTFTPGSGQQAPGDVAATTRFPTATFTSRGKRIYLRKYWHAVFRNSTIPDQLDPGQLAAFDTHAAKMVSGTLPGGMKYCGPQGADVVGTPATSQFLTTRTLKRRGKRPPT